MVNVMFAMKLEEKKFVSGQDIVLSFKKCSWKSYCGDLEAANKLPALEEVYRWAIGDSISSRADIQAAFELAVKSGLLVEGPRPQWPEGRRRWVSESEVSGGGVWVWVNPHGEIIGGETLDYQNVHRVWWKA